MLPKIAALSDTSFSLEKRRARRRSIELGFDAVERRGKTRVLILDLSRTGMRIQTSAMLEVGESLELVIPEAGPVSVTIVRAVPDTSGNEFGCEFDEPITEAAVSAALLAAPPFSPPISLEESDQWASGAEAAFPDVQPISGLLFAVMLVLAVLVVGGFLFALGFLPVSAG